MVFTSSESKISALWKVERHASGGLRRTTPNGPVKKPGELPLVASHSERLGALNRWECEILLSLSSGGSGSHGQRTGWPPF
eukprot:272158-Amorphochlora_amoeboformis.AAC.1